eukprot:CAMPEP_0182428798 /NCGR_PEP_ID=MMETSP1167-20130531/23728_1 /TAXON_ID=2988 /ORGANISM="Mallomonas Sp, Strain CCMP3275" /LENGTH=282 /DNA_ID=CAMNT_0024611911 /DNA_START=169 /DNA_END=1017 /DNA_ORIENTATION=+
MRKIHSESSQKIIKTEGNSVENMEGVNDNDLDIEYTAPRWKMTCYDADDNIFGLDTLDPELGIEIVKVSIPRGDGLGINLVEFKRMSDRRDMTIIESLMPGGNADKSGLLKAGDSICFVGVEPEMERTEGLSLDDTMDTIRNVCPESSSITLVIKRLVKRQELTVIFVNNNGDEANYKILAGSNLRSEMIKKDIQVYDTRTKRYDQPYITGDCGGEGICGTCLVECQYGNSLLNKRDDVEQMVTKKRPNNWRLSCRTIVGANNRKGSVKFRILPQRRWNDNM